MTPPRSPDLFHSENRYANSLFETNSTCRDFGYSGNSGSDLRYPQPDAIADPVKAGIEGKADRSLA